jgi:PAS domain S-box-containing protein
LRNYVLTEKERKTLQTWLQTGEEQPGFYTLKTRITHNFFPISEDIKLITKFLILIEESLPAESRDKTNYIKTWVLEYMREAAPDKIPDVQGIMDKLSKQTRLLGAALENSPEAVVILDKDFNILYVNDAFTRLTGRSREEIIGHVVSGFYGGFDYGDLKLRLQKEGRLMSKAPVEVMGSGGRIKWIEFNASTIKQDNEVLAYTATIRDVTSKKDLERDLGSLLRKLESQ